MSDSTLEALSRFNTIMTNVYSLDNGLRVISYVSALAAQGMRSSSNKQTQLKVAFLDALFGKLCDARFINRLFCFPATVEELYEKGDNSTLSLFGKIMTYSMLVYYPLEHVWYFSTLAPKLFNIDSDKWSMWSCRAWFVYVVFDLLGTWKRLTRLQKQQAATDDKNEKAKLQSDCKKTKMWITCVLADLFMSMHWSVENSPLNENFISLCGVHGGVMGLYIKWLRMSGK